MKKTLLYLMKQKNSLVRRFLLLFLVLSGSSSHVINPNEIATGKNQLAKDVPNGATPTQLAAYTIISRVLLNLDETITKE